MRYKAFTLVETLIVLIIIGVLAGFAYLSMGGADDSAKRAECLGEMEKIKTQYAMDEYGTDEDFKTRIAAVMGNVSQATADGAASDTQAKYKGLCASGGEYTITPGVNSVKVECSIHGGEGGTVADSETDSADDGQFLLPGTKLPPTYSFATEEDFLKYLQDNNIKEILLKDCDTLYLGGKYYVYHTGNATGQALGTDSWNNPFKGSLYSSIQNGWGEIRAIPDTTSPAKEWKDYSTGDVVSKGTIVYVVNENGEKEYYVTTNNDVTVFADDSTGPTNDKNNWFKIATTE